MKVTVKSLAQVAGVSRGTVDRVLHNRGAVKADVAKKIRDLAEQMGYVPNKAGRALASFKAPKKIGVLIPSIGNKFFDAVIVGIRQAQAEFSDLGVEIVLKEIEGYDESVHLNAIDFLLAQGCKALCLATINTSAMSEQINKLYADNIPVILLNNDVENCKKLCYVGSNYLEAGATSAGMLALCNKYEKLNILIVTGSHNIYGHALRIKGFVDELQRSKINFEVIDVVESNDSDIKAQQVTQSILSKKPEINCIFIPGSATSGVGAALIALNRTDIIALAYDEVFTTKELVEEGIISFIICQQPTRQGYHAIKRAYGALAGQFDKTIDDFITDTIIKIKTNL